MDTNKSYEIPEPNVGQIGVEEPRELEYLTKNIDDVLNYVAKARKLNTDLKIYAAGDKKWLRVGFRLEYPTGSVEYTCARAKEAFEKHNILKYEANRAMLALQLQLGFSPEDALSHTQVGYDKAVEMYIDHTLVSLAITNLIQQERYEKVREGLP